MANHLCAKRLARRAPSRQEQVEYVLANGRRVPVYGRPGWSERTEPRNPCPDWEPLHLEAARVLFRYPCQQGDYVPEKSNHGDCEK